MSLGKRIREVRLKRGYTQEYLAKKLGMGRSNFGHIENDRVTPSSEVVQKIADILNVSTDYLYGYVDEDIPEIRVIQRAAKKMTPEDRQRMMKIIKAAFEDAFNDDDDDEGDEDDL